MKKIMFFIATIALMSFAACNSNGKSVECGVAVDTTAVDSVVVDSVSADSVVADLGCCED